jgi:acetoin utilization deacetylase AcuC-like enzyme
VVVLEGGYDFEALSRSTGSTLSAMIGETYRPEDVSTGDVGLPTVTAARQRWDLM